MKLGRSGEQKNRSAGPGRDLKSSASIAARRGIIPPIAFTGRCSVQRGDLELVDKCQYRNVLSKLNQGLSSLAWSKDMQLTTYFLIRVVQELSNWYLIARCERQVAAVVHTDTVLYPLARISLEVEGRAIDVEAAISDTLPMSVLLVVGR